MAQATIWGAAQSKRALCRGVHLVETARHGGLLISKVAVKKYMPEEIYARMPYEYGYYHFEEDADLNLPFFFSPELIPLFVDASYPSDKGTQNQWERIVKHCEIIERDTKVFFPEMVEKYHYEAARLAAWKHGWELFAEHGFVPESLIAD